MFDVRVSFLIRKRLPADADLGARDRLPAEVGDVHGSKIVAAEGHVGGAAEQDGPAVPGEQFLFAVGGDAVDFVGGVTRRVQVAGGVEGKTVGHPADAGGVDLRLANASVAAKGEAENTVGV